MDLSAAAAYNPGKEPQRPYVQFEMRATEDRTIEPVDGVTQMKDVAWAIVRAPGSKDSVEKLATEWLAQLKVYAKDDRVPRNWPSEYAEAYRLWTLGEELPTHGTAIKTWPPLTPAQRRNVLAAGILTVQDLAQVNDEVQARIGMGAVTLKQMAQRWLEEAKDLGATSKKLAEVEMQNQDLKSTLAELSNQVKELQAQLPKTAKVTS